MKLSQTFTVFVDLVPLGQNLLAQIVGLFQHGKHTILVVGKPLARLIEIIEPSSPAVAVPDQQGLGQLVLQPSVFLHSGSLPLQAPQPWFDFTDDVIDTLKIALRLIKARYRILASSPVRSDARGLLKQRHSLLWTKRQDLVNKALADHEIGITTQACSIK